MKYLLCHNICENNSPHRTNPNYDTVDEIKSSADRLTFDGVYLNVYEYRHLLINRNAILFVMGDYVGKDNTFNYPMPLERYCDWDQIHELVDDYGCELGWHTWSHRILPNLSEEEIEKEVKPPFPMKYFAYPHGRISERVLQLVRESGYDSAFSVHETDGTRFSIQRRYMS